MHLAANFSWTGPWHDLRYGKQLTEIWLARQLRPFGISPRTLRLDGNIAKGYQLDDFRETIRRYVSKPTSNCSKRPKASLRSRTLNIESGFVTARITKSQSLYR